MIVSPLEFLAAFAITFVVGMLLGKISNASRVMVRDV